MVLASPMNTSICMHTAIIPPAGLLMTRKYARTSANMHACSHPTPNTPPCICSYCMRRVGQNYIYTVFLAGNSWEIHQIYGYIRCIYTVLANPTHALHFSRCEQNPTPPA